MVKVSEMFPRRDPMRLYMDDITALSAKLGAPSRRRPCAPFLFRVVLRGSRLIRCTSGDWELCQAFPSFVAASDLWLARVHSSAWVVVRYIA